MTSNIAKATPEHFRPATQLLLLLNQRPRPALTPRLYLPASLRDYPPVNEIERFRVNRMLCFPRIFAVLTLAFAFAGTIVPIVARAAGTNSSSLVPLKLDLPAPAYRGTPKNVPLGPFTDPPSNKPRAPFMVPPGLTNLARAAKITSSDKTRTREQLAKIVDGDKDSADSSILLLRKGTQYVQLDLGAPCEVFAIVLWHAHNSAKVYHDVIVQVSDDPDFAQGVTTLFNNDHENASGLGVGSDREYFESFEGRLIDAKGVRARYVRCYSRGSTESPLNEYTEIEVYGRAGK